MNLLCFNRSGEKTMKREDVLDILQAHRSELVNPYHVRSLLLFGSMARDEARPDSDVDLLVEFDRPVGLFQFIELQQRLETLLGCKVDLGTKRSLKPAIKKQVIEEAIRVA
jgi:predicted nucleotidyltransferase